MSRVNHSLPGVPSLSRCKVKGLPQKVSSLALDLGQPICVLSPGDMSHTPLANLLPTLASDTSPGTCSGFYLFNFFGLVFVLFFLQYWDFKLSTLCLLGRPFLL
jgi:hypothetical protein